MYYRGTYHENLVKEKAKSLPGIYRGVKHGPLSPSSTQLKSGVYRGVRWVRPV